MNGSSTSSPFGARSRPGGASLVSGLLQAVEEFRRPAESRSAPQPERDDARDAVLSILAEQPMHGYQIVHTLQARHPGARTPGAGSVYPLLQLLADQGLATATEADGRKTYALTDAGRAAAAATAGRAVPVATAETAAPERRGAITKAGAQLAVAAGLLTRSGTPAQVADAVTVLDEARRKLYAILARN